MTPDQALVMLLRGEAEARPLFTPRDSLNLVDSAASMLLSVAAQWRSLIELSATEAVNEQQANDLAMKLQRQLFAATINAVLAFELSPITGLMTPLDDGEKLN